MSRLAQTRNPGEMNSRMNGRISVTEACSGELRAISVAPRMQRPQPCSRRETTGQPRGPRRRSGRRPDRGLTSQPKKDSFSLRKKCDRMAHTTTESAPRGCINDETGRDQIGPAPTELRDGGQTVTRIAREECATGPSTSVDIQYSQIERRVTMLTFRERI